MPHFNTKFQVDKYRVAGSYTENECYKYPNEYYIIKLTQNIFECFIYDTDVEFSLELILFKKKPNINQVFRRV